MNSDDWFEDLDDAALQQIDAIEAAALSKASTPPTSIVTLSDTLVSDDYGRRNINPPGHDCSFDLSFDIDESELQQLDRHVNSLLEGHTRLPLSKTNSTNNTRQTTLDGGFVTSPKRSQSTRSRIQRAKSSSSNVFGEMAPKAKKWDHTEFAKTGIKPVKRSKGRKKEVDPDGWGEEEGEEFDQFPAPYISIGPPPPMKLVPDLLEAKHWLYPLNQPKRDYQFNIVKHCLFKNTLVALPTGLGKTFIAGSVMLNYYRWFPKGKVVFVAPTKPLVTQQIHACHKVCGIPGTDAVELTGAVQKYVRAKYWEEKRVFYMTPQTLRNDLMEDTCDALDIVLLVIDEAHRAGSGGYAYNQVVRLLMAKNPHFRVLSLTATPGSNPEAVQNLIDSLHISHIEIRDEMSLDIRKYMHEKSIEQHVISMSDNINRTKDLLVKVMDPIIQPLKQRGVLFGGSPIKMHPYMPSAKMRSLRAHEKWAFLPLTKLSTLARAMGYLMEGTVSMCYHYLRGQIGEEGAAPPVLGEDKSSSPKKKKADAPKRQSKIKWRNESSFMAVMAELESQRSSGFQIHPKMEVLRELVVNYFERRKGEGEGEEGGPSKAMIFVTFRHVVDEIVEILNAHQPLVRASKFVGQASDTQGGKGMSQKRQLEVIRQFKADEYNVLVATSIGEEGLDIGEVDFIVCYDAQKTPIRMLQRLGRTGRQRDGTVHVLLAEHREEFNMEQAKNSYKEVQKTIWRGNQLELYDDVERLLPESVKPQCLEKVMEITPYEPEQPYRRAENNTLKASKTKRKRNNDIIPIGASMGFVRASELSVNGTKKRKTGAIKVEKKNFDEQGVDDDTDKEIESGLIVLKPRRTKSSSAGSLKPKPERKPRLRKAVTLDSGSKKNARKKADEDNEDPTSSQFSQLGRDDSDDMDIEQVTLLSSSPSGKKRANSPEAGSSMLTEPSQGTPKTFELGKNAPLTPSSTGAIIDLTNTDSEAEADINEPSPSSRHLPANQYAGEDLSWLVEDDDEMSIRIASSSPIVPKKRPELLSIDSELDKSMETIEPSNLSPVTRCNVKGIQDGGYEPIVVMDEGAECPSSGRQTSGEVTSQVNCKGKRRRIDMPPPDLPISCPSPDVPVSAFPVKRRGQARDHDLLSMVDGYSSPAEEMPLKRLRRHPATTTPARTKIKKGKLIALEAQHNPLFDVVANHSGDEVSEGASNSEDVESETDRMFIKNSPLTQVSGSYDQSLIYRQSLLTQTSADVDVPQFANGPARLKLFGRRGGTIPVVQSSSPARGEGGSDDYEFGSFVVPDDADVL